jgi:hypothetical protein
MKGKMFFVILVLSMLVVALSACSLGSVRVGYVGSNFGNHSDFSYTTLTGRDVNTFSVNDGETLTLNYDVEMDKGVLTISLLEKESGDLVWDRSFETSEFDQVSFEDLASGKYQLRFEGQIAGGGYDVEWVSE